MLTSRSGEFRSRLRSFCLPLPSGQRHSPYRSPGLLSGALHLLYTDRSVYLGVLECQPHTSGDGLGSPRGISVRGSTEGIAARAFLNFAGRFQRILLRATPFRLNISALKGSAANNVQPAGISSFSFFSRDREATSRRIRTMPGIVFENSFPALDFPDALPKCRTPGIRA